jgi:hypothetical protein
MINSWVLKIGEYFKKIWFLWVLCLILSIITFLFVYYKISPSEKTLALHYNVLVGVEWYGKGKNIYFIPLVGFLISLVNYIFYKALKNNQNFLSFLTVFVSLCIQIILLVSVLFLARVN